MWAEVPFCFYRMLVYFHVLILPILQGAWRSLPLLINISLGPDETDRAFSHLVTVYSVILFHEISVHAFLLF